jgi:poly(3-hydroxybutyrate) depolymerase
VISFNGTDDPLHPFGGYSDPVEGLLSVPDTIAYWVRANGCDPNAKIEAFPQSAIDDGTSVKRLTYLRGSKNAEVVAYIVVHGGHTWPGNHTDPTWAKTAGKTAMSVKAQEAILDFFENHPKS